MEPLAKLAWRGGFFCFDATKKWTTKPQPDSLVFANDTKEKGHDDVLERDPIKPLESDATQTFSRDGKCVGAFDGQAQNADYGSGNHKCRGFFAVSARGGGATWS